MTPLVKPVVKTRLKTSKLDNRLAMPLIAKTGKATQTRIEKIGKGTEPKHAKTGKTTGKITAVIMEVIIGAIPHTRLGESLLEWRSGLLSPPPPSALKRRHVARWWSTA